MVDKNPFPEIRFVKCPPVLESVVRAGKAIGGVIFNTNVPAPNYMSNHYVREHFVDEPAETGGAAMLDKALNTQPQLPLADAGWDAHGEFRRL